MAEKQRPATIVLIESLTIRLARGIPTACTPGRYSQAVSVAPPPKWSSIGAPHNPIWSSNWRAAQDVVSSHAVIAVDPAGLANTDLSCKGDQVGLLITRYPIDQEAGILERLTPPRHFRRSQDVGIGGIDYLPVPCGHVLDPRHDRGRHVPDRGDVVAALDSGEVEVTRIPRLGHQPMQLFLGDRLAAADVDIGHPERGGECLGGAEFSGQLVSEPGVVATSASPEASTTIPGLDGLEPGLGGHCQTGHPSILDGCRPARRRGGARGHRHL